MEGMKNAISGPIAAPSLVMYPRPLGGERIERFESFLPGETLGRYVRRVGLAAPSRVVRVEHNGREVPLALWERLIPRHGDMVVISARALGGGGGGKVLRTVAMLAVVAAAFYAPYLAGLTQTVNGVTSVTLGGTLLSAGVMIGGSMLVNAFLPMPNPTAANLGTGEKYEASPTYSISGGRNQARPWEPMTLIFGRHRVVPDLGATPYTQAAFDDQYLNQCFHFGLQGTSLQIEDIRLGQTPIDSFQGVQLQRAGADGKLSLIAGDVDTIQGFTIGSADGWVSRRTATGVANITVELASRLFSVADSGAIVARSVDVRIQYRRVGTDSWVEIGNLAPTLATHYWALLDANTSQQIEFGSANPSEHTAGERKFYDPALYADSAGLAGYGYWNWVPHPYQQGRPWQGVAPDPVLAPGQPGVRLTGARQDATRRQVAWDVVIGQYDVRVMKVTADVNTSRESNETAVSQILAFQRDLANYEGQARLAVRIKASGQLNGAINDLNAIVSAMSPAWDGTNWVTMGHSNPAWWFLWFARGKADATGNRLYGGLLADSQIDIEGIKAWATWCSYKQLTFDYVLDRKMSAAAVLQLIARAGRASLTYQTGKLGVVWDAENQPEVGVFGPFNVKAGSFKLAYVNDGTVDEIVANFANKELDWKMDEVRVKVPGTSTSNNPLQLDLDGWTDKDAAGREANLLAAAQLWKRRKITWETDIEGLLCTRGDVVRFSHDLTVWGFSGRMMPGSGGTTIRLQNKVASAGAGTALLRDPDGNLKMVAVTGAVGEVDELTIVTPLDGFPMPGDPGYEDMSPFDWVYQFDPQETPGRRFKITGVTPSGDGIRYEAVDDDPEYYASENNPYQYTPPRDGALLAGVVFSITGAEQIVSVAADQIRLGISWVLSTDTPCLVVVSVNGVRRIEQLQNGRSLDVLVSTSDTVDVTVTPKRSTGSGTPKSQRFTILGLGAPLPAVTGLQSVFRDGLTWLAWDRVQDVRQPAYEVRRGDTWTNSEVVAVTTAPEQIAVGNGLYFVSARFALSNGTVIYGAPDTLLISGATLVRNVLVSRNEAPGWDGDLAGGAVVHHGMLTLAPQGDVLAISDIFAVPDVLWLGGPAASGSFTIDEANQVDIGFVAAVRVDLQVTYHVANLSADILSVDDVLALDDVLNSSDRQFVRVRPQVRFAQEAGEWTEWRDYVPGLLNGRYFDVRLQLETLDPNLVPFIDQFTWSIDVPDLIQRGEALAVSGAGVEVTYSKAFHAVPNVQLTLLDAQEGDRTVLTDSTETGFHVQVMNGGTPVAGILNWISQGY